ncbi:Quaking related protein, partial [Operophtera brumata]
MPSGRPGGPHGRPPPRAPPRMSAPPMGRMPPKTKVISILDRARSAMESNYSYDDPYGAPEPPMRVPPRQQEQEFYFDRAPERFYEDDSYYKEDSRNDYKQTSARE